MRFFWIVLCSLAVVCCAQEMPPAEQESLRTAIGEAGNSPVEFMRAVENHLAKYPLTTRRPDLEKAVAKTAVDLKDARRIALYGGRVLDREPDNMQFLDPVATALLEQKDETGARRALAYAHHFEELVALSAKEESASGRERAKRHLEQEIERSRALLLQARALNILGQRQKAVELAQKSFEEFPAAESARECATLVAANGETDRAIEYLADAFTIPDPRTTDADRQHDRIRLGELYRKSKGAEAGLGDLILRAYDRTTALIAERRLVLRQFDPNLSLSNPMEFTLTGLGGVKLPLSSLKGKVIVMDFWATWCNPCRVQHPLYEEVRAKFKDRDDVVFLAVDADEDHDAVEPFLDQQKWSKTVYFEDGLQTLLKVSSLPTTLIFGKQGELVNRMVGFAPERFVGMLTERIRAAL